jgi:hypothetical protein
MSDDATNVVPFERPPAKVPSPPPQVLHFREFYLNPQTFRLTMARADGEGNIVVRLEFACSKVWPPTFDMGRVIEAWAGQRGMYEPVS